MTTDDITEIDPSALNASIAERQKAREIVHEVIKFGVTERQKLMIVKFLGEHIEDYKIMQLLTWLADELLMLNDDVTEAKLAELRQAACLRLGLMVGGT